MGRAKLVEINGRKYDAATGKLIKSEVKHNKTGSIDGVVKAKPASQVHTRTSRTKTLNRSAVKKPAVKVSHQKVKPGVVSREQQAQQQVGKVDPVREARAKRTAKSSLISRFGRSSAPAAAVAQPAVAAPIAPVRTTHVPPLTKAQQAEYSPNPSNKDKADKPARKKTKRFRSWSAMKPKARSVFAASTAAALLLAYVTYLNIPNFSLRIAASRSGIDATLPGYKPDGFAMAGPIQYSAGMVTINFDSNTDDRNFKVVERESTWDSKSLQANYVERETPDYVTFQDRGLTIYVYNGSNATWVDSGIWYTIEGDSQLNSDQLLKIAASM